MTQPFIADHRQYWSQPLVVGDGESVEGRAGRSVNPRHRHHVARDEGVKYAEKLAPR
jgi:hypothetical protein